VLAGNVLGPERFQDLKPMYPTRLRPSDPSLGTEVKPPRCAHRITPSERRAMRTNWRLKIYEKNAITSLPISACEFGDLPSLERPWPKIVSGRS
jgi:hypothetical protein